jgi:hypothetical protein
MHCQTYGVTHGFQWVENFHCYHQLQPDVTHDPVTPAPQNVCRVSEKPVEASERACKLQGAMPCMRDHATKPWELGPERMKQESSHRDEVGFSAQEKWHMIRTKGRHATQIMMREEAIPLHKMNTLSILLSVG